MKKITDYKSTFKFTNYNVDLKYEDLKYKKNGTVHAENIKMHKSHEEARAVFCFNFSCWFAASS